MAHTENCGVRSPIPRGHSPACGCPPCIGMCDCGENQRVRDEQKKSPENLKKFAELDTANRGMPCQEYPGEWLVMIPESLGSHWTRFWFNEHPETLGHSHKTFDEAHQKAKEFFSYLEKQKVEYDPTRISIAWKCSENDPRVGEVWFTGFYTHGRFTLFGDYRST